MVKQFFLSHWCDPGQSAPESNGNEKLFYIPQSSRTGDSLSDAIYCYIQDTHLVGYPPAEMQSAYSVVIFMCV